MSKEKNQVLEYLGKIENLYGDLTMEIACAICEFDDGQQRDKQESKDLAAQYLQNGITELENLRSKFVSGDPLKD